MSVGSMRRIRSASNSSASVGSITGIIALMNALVTLDDLPVTVIAAGSWQSGVRFITHCVGTTTPIQRSKRGAGANGPLPRSVLLVWGRAIFFLIPNFDEPELLLGGKAVRRRAGRPNDYCTTWFKHDFESIRIESIGDVNNLLDNIAKIKGCLDAAGMRS